MTTPPTFTNGTPLYQESLNAIGLWLVKSQAIVGSPSIVTVTDAFSASYDAYRIIATGVTSTGAGNSASLQLSGLTSGYYASIVYCVWSSTTVVGSVDNNQASWNFAGSFSSDGLVLDLDLANPFLAKPTVLSGGSYASHLGGSVNGKQTSSTSATGFTVTTPGGTMTGGTISVYGYRKA